MSNGTTNTTAKLPQNSMPPPDTTNAPNTGTLIPPADQKISLTSPGAAAPTTQAPVAPALNRKQMMESRVKAGLGDIFQTLAGGQRKVWGNDETTGEPKLTYAPLKPGEMARGILAAAIVGLAGGYDPANRGKGPAMSAAFSGGFKAEQAMREKTEDTQEKEAQQKFINKNLADDQAMKKAKHAQDMTEGISRVALQRAQIDKLLEDMKEGKETHDEAMIDLVGKRRQIMSDLWNKGYRPLAHPEDKNKTAGNPNLDNLGALAEKHPDYMTGGQDLNTQPVYNVDTHMYETWAIDPNYETKRQWQGALYKDGKIQMDPKNPKVPLPDGHNKDGNGQNVTPEFTDGASWTARMNGYSQEREVNATTASRYAEAQNYISESQNRKETKDAEGKWAASGNDPMKMNIETGDMVMDKTTRTLLINTTVDVQKAAEQARKEAVDARRDATDPKDIEAWGQKIKENSKIIEDSTKSLNEMSQGFSTSQMIAENFRAAYTTDGKFDQKAALKKFDEAVKTGPGYVSYTLADKNAARALIQAYPTEKKTEKTSETGGKETPTMDQKTSDNIVNDSANTKTLIGNIRDMGMSEDDGIKAIQNAPSDRLNDNEKQAAIQYLKNHPPGPRVFAGPSGQRQTAEGPGLIQTIQNLPSMQPSPPAQPGQVGYTAPSPSQGPGTIIPTLGTSAPAAQ
jgi:hypothetical protein